MAGDAVHTLVGKSLRSRAAVVAALCVAAEDEFESGQLLRAVETVRSMRKVLADITVLLDGDTSQIPVSDLRTATEALAGIEARVQKIEAAVSPPRIQ